MDGWAVRRADAQSASTELLVIGESAAGRGFDGVVEPGQAVRIFTGAALPAGADAVVIQENAERCGDRVRLGPLAKKPDHVRPRGGDFHAGDRLIEPGLRLDAWRLSLAAAAGFDTLPIALRPRVAVLCTGEELVRPPAKPGPFQIYESGSAALCALIEAWGGIAQRLEAARDDEASVIARAVANPGRSDRDRGRRLSGRLRYRQARPGEALGLELKVASVNVRPGKPTWFGVLGDGRRVLGLPGNPSSAMVCAQLFLRPLVLALQGADPTPTPLFAKLAQPLPANGAREHLMRASLNSSADGVLLARPFDDQDSGLVGVFAQADALLRRPANAPAAAAGDPVEVLRLDRL
jgi:molybdopterin molybdotransferase